MELAIGQGLRFLRFALLLGISSACLALDHNITEAKRKPPRVNRGRRFRSDLGSITGHRNSSRSRHGSQNPKGGPLQTYYFAVNPWTGDVWDGIACTRITSPKIQREQESIWKRSGLPEEARKPLTNKSPGKLFQRRGAATVRSACTAGCGLLPELTLEKSDRLPYFYCVINYKSVL